MPAKGTSRFIVTPKILARVEAKARKGLTQEQIADVLGINFRTLYKHKKTNREFREAIKRGQSKGIDKVTNALFNNAINGNIAAQIFYLKNRGPDTWKDKQHIDETTRIVKPSQIDSKTTPDKAAASYADTLKTGTGGAVVPLRRK